MINVNATIFLQIIHFLILLFILNRLLIQPILKVINDRVNHMANGYKQLEDFKEEAKGLIEKCASIERNARIDAGEESSRLRKEATEIAEKIFSDTREEVTAIRGEAEKMVDNKLKEAQQYLQNEAAILADELIEKVMGRRFAN
jgi:F-type H+-transporting ATPase subunit b